MVQMLTALFGRKQMIILLLLINIPGTIYGYVWYYAQLKETPIVFLPFVPDSPTASLFFVIILIAFLFNRHWPLFEALAAVTLIKYGVWAVTMNVAITWTGGVLNWQHYMLIFSHAGMAIQAVIYAPFYRIKGWHLLVAGLWTTHNDIIDYVYMMHPSVTRSLLPYIDHIGYFTFWLSVFSLVCVYFLSVRKDSLKLDLIR